MSVEKLHALDIARTEHDQRLKRVEEALPKFVTIDQFSTVKALAYGLATIILVGFCAAITRLAYK